MTRVRILLADDHCVARAGMRALLDCPGMEVVAEAQDGLTAVRLTTDHRPDVAVIDYNMPGLTGAEVASRVRAEAPGVRVLVLSAHEDRAFLRHVLEAGASGYVLKRAAAEELIQAIRVVGEGGTYLDPGMAAHVVAGYVGGVSASVLPLSEREEEVIRLIAVGYVNKEVGSKLGLSVKTIETYKLRAMDKLGCQSRVDLVKYAHRRGWFDDLWARSPGVQHTPWQHGSVG
jgi:DNA-binding NarL/FixJ family response regulator